MKLKNKSLKSIKLNWKRWAFSLKGATKLYSTHFLCLLYKSLQFLPILLENYFFVFLSFLCFLPVLCRIRCKLFKHFTLHDHCLHSSRCQGLCVLCLCSHLFEPFVKIDTRHKNLSIALNKNMSLESIWAFNF